MRSKEQLKRQALGLLVGYAVQFIAGMVLNLFVTVTPKHPGANSANYFTGDGHGIIWALSGHGGAALAIHVYIALALVFGSLGLLATSIKAKNQTWTWCSGLAFLATVGALFNGLSFINYSHDFSSMVMASCWLIAVAALVYGVVSSREP